MSWNRQEGKSENAKNKRRGGRFRVPPVLLVLLVLLVVAAGVWWAVRGPAGRVTLPDREGRAPSRPIAEAHPAKMTVGNSQPDAESPRPRSNVPPEQQVMHTNMYGYVINRPSTAVVITNKVDDADRPFEERVFKNSADQKIAGLLLLKPGEMLVGDPSSLFGRGFARAFLKSIESPIIVSKDDDEATAELKRAVIDSKIEIKARHDAGEDIGALMAKEYKELQTLGLYREELKDQIAKLARDKTLREEDMEDFVKAANMMLEARGASPLQMPRFAARRFLLERRRQGQGQATEAAHQGEAK